MKGLRRIAARDVLTRDLETSGAVRDTLDAARAIVEEVRRGGDAALRTVAERLGDLKADEPVLLERDDLDRALSTLPSEERELLERTADRIRTFARAQLQTLLPLETPIGGGRAGTRWNRSRARAATRPEAVSRFPPRC